MNIKNAWKTSKLFMIIDENISRQYIRKLENDGFTILCPNCVGGNIYHRLRKQFLSPTINMYMKQPDFISFLLYLDDYLKCELSFIETDLNHPVATLGGVQSSTYNLIFQS